MSLTRIRDTAVEIIRNLPNRPTGTGHMTAAALKMAFDQAAENIKNAVNQMIGQLEDAGGAAEIGFQRSTAVPADDVQSAIENVQGQIAGVSQGAVPNGSITAEKMAAGAAGFRNVTSLLSITKVYEGYPCDISALRFMFSAALNLMIVEGTVGFTKSGSGGFSSRYTVTGPFNFGYHGGLISQESEQGNPRVNVSPLGDDILIDLILNNVPDDLYQNYAAIDLSAWLFCEEAT